MGDYVFGIGNIDCRKLKVKGLRFFTIQYREEQYVLNNDDFKEVIKIVDYARKNKKDEQQKIIDEIKQKLKQFGMSFN